MPADILAIFEATDERSAMELGAGEILFRRGDAVRWFYVLVKGRVRLSRVLPRGTEISLARVGPNEIIAEASLYGPRYHCDAIAELDCQLWRFSARDVRTLLAREPKAAAAYGA